LWPEKAARSSEARVDAVVKSLRQGGLRIRAEQMLYGRGGALSARTGLRAGWVEREVSVPNAPGRVHGKGVVGCFRHLTYRTIHVDLDLSEVDSRGDFRERVIAATAGHGSSL